MVDTNLLLMIPGPIQPEREVMKVMGDPVKAHYGSEWTEIYNLTIEALRKIFNTQGDVFLMVGSGSCALDSCLGSAFSTGEKVIVGVNGFFGERLKAISDCYGLNTIIVESEWGEPFKPSDFEKVIQKNQDAIGVCVVHLETSTTIINPIEEIGKIVRKQGMCYVVDAVSSLGGIPLKIDDWNIDLCASASQKCLGAPPGLAPVAVGERGWEFIDRNKSKGHGWYTNLNIWRKFSKEWADWHPFPITMATNNVLALKTSLDSVLQEGVELRMERYRQLAIRLRNGLRGLGLNLYTPDELMSPVLTASYSYPGIPASEVITYLEEKHHIKIAGGLGSLKNKIIRISHMAPTTSEEDIDRVLSALNQFKS
ncbi:MAG: alanine--glyoxylate aminotransferase family protein [Anaerolineales bacterium]|nr:alanine--glyoxylate aminotransferase family protein [Anaerolineales bacterium]